MEKLCADWLSGGAKRRELGVLKGQGNAPWQAPGRENEEGGGEAEFGRRKGVWRGEDYSWASPPRLRMYMGETNPTLQKIAVCGLGLGAKGEGETGFFFLISEETRKQASARGGRAWGARLGPRPTPLKLTRSRSRAGRETLMKGWRFHFLLPATYTKDPVF